MEKENDKSFDLFKSLENDLKQIVKEMDENTKSNWKKYRTFKVIWADQTLNRNNRQLVVSWIDTTDYLKNPVIFINHDQSVNSLVWRATKVTKDLKNKQIIFEWQFADTELWNMVADLYEQWFLTTVSLWYNIVKRDDFDPRICLETYLYECSFVAIPANVNAKKMDSISQDKLDKLIEVWLVIKEEDLAIFDEIKDEKENIEDKKTDAKEWPKEWQTIYFRKSYNNYICPEMVENPYFWKIVKVYDNWEQILDYWSTVIIWTKDNPLVLVQHYVRNDEKKLTMLYMYVDIYYYNSLIIEWVLDSVSNIDNLSNFSNIKQEKTDENEKKLEKDKKNDIMYNEDDISEMIKLWISKISFKNS